MDTEQWIPADAFCTHFNIEVAFIQALESFGLIEVTTIQEKRFIPNDRLKDLEQYVHLHYDLGINLEGIDAITHMLHRVKAMQQEVAQLRYQLQAYHHSDSGTLPDEAYPNNDG